MKKKQRHKSRETCWLDNSQTACCVIDCCGVFTGVIDVSRSDYIRVYLTRSTLWDGEIQGNIF